MRHRVPPPRVIPMVEYPLFRVGDGSSRPLPSLDRGLKTLFCRMWLVSVLRHPKERSLRLGLLPNFPRSTSRSFGRKTLSQFLTWSTTVYGRLRTLSLSLGNSLRPLLGPDRPRWYITVHRLHVPRWNLRRNERT